MKHWRLIPVCALVAVSGAASHATAEAVDLLKKNGMEVVSLSKDEVAAFRARTKPVYDKWAGKVGADLVKSAESIVAGTK